MSYRRTTIKQFALANSAYANASVLFYNVDTATNESNGTLATLYSNHTGTATLANPVTLDANGKNPASLYVESPVIAVVRQAAVPDHDTGVIWPSGGNYRGNWTTATTYLVGDVVKDSTTNNVYIAVVAHTSTSIAADVASEYLQLHIELEGVGDIDDSVAAAAASASAAATSATNASTSATAASTSASESEAWADTDEDVEVESGKYSAKHWAAKAEASAGMADSKTLADDDDDTKVEVERTADIDTVYIKAAGTDVLTATSSGVAVTGTLSSTGNVTGNNLSGTNTGDEVPATISTAGVVELATIAETNAGTDLLAVTAYTLAGSNYGVMPVTFSSDAAITMATGNGFFSEFEVPSILDGFDLINVLATVETAGTGGTCSIQVHNVTQTADMLSTPITIDASEKTSATALTAAVIDTANDDVATSDRIRIDVDTVHSTTAAKGLIVYLFFRKP